jgi:hypothetical protein
MSEYKLQIMRREYDTDDYHDGDRGPCLRERDESDTYDAELAEGEWDDKGTDNQDEWVWVPETHTAWAIRKLRPMASFEPSAYPVQTTAGAHEWLTANDHDPYTSHEDEITVYLTGDWTDTERAEVYRAVTAN